MNNLAVSFVMLQEGTKDDRRGFVLQDDIFVGRVCLEVRIFAIVC